MQPIPVQTMDNAQAATARRSSLRLVLQGLAIKIVDSLQDKILKKLL